MATLSLSCEPRTPDAASVDSVSFFFSLYFAISWWDSLILMQGQRRTIGSFPAIVSMMQEPSSSGTDMNHQSSLNHVQNAVDFRLPDYRGSSCETVCLRGTGPNVSFRGWNTGEPSSGLNLINQVDDEGLKLEHGLSASCGATVEDGLKPEERLLLGNQSRIHPSFLQGSSSNHTTQNIDLDMGKIANAAADRGKGKDTGSDVNNNNPSGLDREKTSFGSASCNPVETSSASSEHMAWADSTSSSSSLVNWGPSCKRKTLEDSSMELCAGGSSGSFVQPENGYQPTNPVDLNASSSLSDGSPLEDFPVTTLPLQLNIRNEVRQEASTVFPSMIRVTENEEGPLRNFGRRITHQQHQESVPVNLTPTGSARHHNHRSPHQISGALLFNDSLELRLTAGTTAANSGTPQNQSPALHMHPFPWNRDTNPGVARGSTSYNSGERTVHEDFNLRILPNTQHPVNTPASSRERTEHEDFNLRFLANTQQHPINMPASSGERTVHEDFNLRILPNTHHPINLHASSGERAVREDLNLRILPNTQHPINVPASSRERTRIIREELNMRLLANNRQPINVAASSGERAVHEDFNLRILPNTQHPINVPSSSGHEPTGWHLSSSSVNNAGGIPPTPTPWIGSSSNVNPLPNPSWTFNHEVPTENLQRVSEFSPWSLSPSISSASGTHNSQPPSTSGPPSFSQGSSINQPHLRTTYLMERRGGDVHSAAHSWRALASDNDGRRRLISEIRQVLTAMRRGETLRAEDYMLIDPFLQHGITEFHDRHRGMRLDVDNMSYEELLALEERIGDVSTGLSEDNIVKLMKQRIYTSVMTESPSDLEPCCICQEQYADGDNVGSLDCGHEFHSDCIKQWLTQKNLCPICKTTALAM